LVVNLIIMKVKVDKDKCIGCGLCVSLAPKSFKLGEDGKSQAIESVGDDLETIKNAAESCPVSAIEIAE